jgi:hypothetical protein
MDWSVEAIAPAARSDGIVVEHLDGETLVYDLERDRAHLLNPTAAAVFALCDGRMTVAELAEQAGDRLGESISAETVREALERLAERRLLASRVPIDGVSRREVVRKGVLVGAGAAVAAPLIKSIVVPTPAQAQTACIPSDLPCDPFNPGLCCSLCCRSTVGGGPPFACC